LKQPETTNEKSIETVMAALANGEQSALIEWFRLATSPIRGIISKSFHAKDIHPNAELLNDIVRDCVVELARIAPSWRPDGGAKPWNWARPRLVAFAYKQLGTFADDIDDHTELADDGAVPTGPDMGDVIELFGGLRTRDPILDLLGEALELVAGQRDRRVWLEMLIESFEGNRSPAVTVAVNNEIKPANARKVNQRMNGKLINLAVTTTHFGPLLRLPALAA